MGVFLSGLRSVRRVRLHHAGARSGLSVTCNVFLHRRLHLLPAECGHDLNMDQVQRRQAVIVAATQLRTMLRRASAGSPCYASILVSERRIPCNLPQSPSKKLGTPMISHVNGEAEISLCLAEVPPVAFVYCYGGVGPDHLGRDCQELTLFLTPVPTLARQIETTVLTVR